MSSVVVFGGYGTFGRHVARELARAGIPLLIAGRDGTRARAFARELGPAHGGLSADVADPRSCREALRGRTVAVHCAGPYAEQPPVLLEACLEGRCHYADIADDRGYTARVRAFGPRFRERGLVAVHGCSSLPGLSGALALAAREGATAAPERVRCTLFIGNANPKGRAAIEALVRTLGRPIRAPQGLIRGFRDREVVPLPEPFGPRATFNFDSPEYDLFPALLGVRDVSVKLAFELRSVTSTFALLAALRLPYGRGTAAVLERVGRWFRSGGSSGAVVMSELFWPGGSACRAALLARHDGQRLAALPCALAAQALCDGGSSACGAQTVFEFLGASTLLDRLTAAGFELLVGRENCATCR